MSMPTEVEAAYIPTVSGGVYLLHCPNCLHEYQWSRCTPDEIVHCDCGFVLKVIPEEIEEEEDEDWEDEEEEDNEESEQLKICNQLTAERLCCEQPMEYVHGDNGNGGYEYGWYCETCEKTIADTTEWREG